MNGTLDWTVAFADTDSGGVMYHARYVELAERSRLQWLLDVGWGCKRVAEACGVNLVVHRLQAAYQQAARLEDRLVAQSWLVEAGPVRCRWRTEIRRLGALLCTVDADTVAVALAEPALVRTPQALLAALEPIADGASPPRTAARPRPVLVNPPR